MSRSCNKLAFAVSSATSIPLQSFRRIFDRLYVTDAVPLGFHLDDVRIHRTQVARGLVGLASCDFLYGPHDCVRACAPHLALVPSAGLPSAVLSGARTPSVLARFKSVVRAHSDSAALTVSEQTASPLLPSRLCLMAISVDVLRVIADTVHLPLATPCPASVLAGFSVDLNTYLASRQWRSHGSEPNWRRRDFDAGRLRFGSPPAAQTEFRLSEYAHPQYAHRREHVLIDAGRQAAVDRDWGRYAALANAGRHVLHYDAGSCVPMVPIGVPLPLLFARALTLCSGFASAQVEVAGMGRMDAFTQVPSSIASALAAKLNQGLVSAQSGTLPRGLYD